MFEHGELAFAQLEHSFIQPRIVRVLLQGRGKGGFGIKHFLPVAFNGIERGRLKIRCRLTNIHEFAERSLVFKLRSHQRTPQTRQ